MRALFSKAKDKLGAAEPPAPPATHAAGLPGWVRAGRRFDVHRMSKDELREMAYELLAGGAISMPDLRLLALDPLTRAPHWPDWSTFETAGESGARRDWIEEISARIRKGHPEHAYIGYLRLLLSFLMRVEAAGRLAAQTGQPAERPSRPSPALARRPVRLTSPLPSG